MNIPTDQSLDYLDRWCCGWNRRRAGLSQYDKEFGKNKIQIEGWKARKHLEKEIERAIRNKKALNKILNESE